MIEISRVFEALRSRQGLLFPSGFRRRISKTELTTHHKKLISEAFQLHRFHYLMKEGRFEKLDESFLAPDSPLGEKFAAEYHSSSREISRRKFRINPAALDVDAFNVAILKVAALAPNQTGGTFGLITRDKVLYGLDAANRKDSKVLLPWEYALEVFLKSHQGSKDYWPHTLTYGQSEETDTKIDRLLQAKIDNDTRSKEIQHLQGVVADLGFIGETANAFSELVSSMYQWLANENIWDLQGVEKSRLAQDADDEWQTALEDLDEVIFETSLSLERAIKK